VNCATGGPRRATYQAIPPIFEEKIMNSEITVIEPATPAAEPVTEKTKKATAKKAKTTKVRVLAAEVEAAADALTKRQRAAEAELAEPAKPKAKAKAKPAKQAKPNGKAKAKVKGAKAKAEPKTTRGKHPSGMVEAILKLASRAKGVSPAELNELTKWKGAPWKWLFKNPKGNGYCDRWGYSFEVLHDDNGTHYKVAKK
jgi:hypothetical protein